MATKKTDRSALIAELLHPYRDFSYSAGHGLGPTIEWALVAGAAEITADALLENPDSNFWRCKFPLESGSDGAAIRWLRETMAGDAEADARFDAYALVPGCETPRRTAEAVRWMIQRKFTAAQAIAALNIQGVDSPLSQLDYVSPYVRERLIRAFPASARASLREKYCDYID
jgi:hypothetical protein